VSHDLRAYFSEHPQSMIKHPHSTCNHNSLVPPLLLGFFLDHSVSLTAPSMQCQISASQIVAEVTNHIFSLIEDF